ncbi:MAG TPA: O-antigen ligase family protein [Candidatus Dormibacteraeota bacterium]
MRFDIGPETVQTQVERTTAGSPLARWILAVAVFLIPLSFLPTTVDEFVLPKLLLARLLVMVLAIVLVAGWLRRGAVTWKRTALDLPLVAFIGSAAISSIFAVNGNVAIFGVYDRWEGLLTITTYALLFWLAVQLMSGERDARWMTWSLLSSGYLIAAVAVLQSALGVLGAGSFGQSGAYFRADATMAHPDFLGIFLAMLLPIAFAKLISRRPLLTRVLAANLVIVLSLGLLATFTRSAWIGAVVGIAVVLALRGGRFRALPLIAFAAVLMIGFATLAGIVAARPSSAQGGIANAIYSRIVSSVDLSSGSIAERLAVWKDTPAIIASRPVLGYGPDNFALVFPLFQTSNRNSVLFTDPHEEALGVLATQGVVGFLAYLWILVAFVRAFWAGRHQRGAVALFAGWVAYQVSMQVDFSYIPTAVPFWLFAAAAIVTWAPGLKPARVVAFPPRIGVPALAAGSLALAALAIPAVVLPYLADADYYSSQAAPTLPEARATIAQARSLAPYEATYAIEAGNDALNQDANGVPAADADWAAAREAYETAARLGSYSPEMFQNLATVDEHLGDHAAALAAARRAFSLDPYDPDSLALLTKLGG